jgi:LuxR family maltose regulon positive regulatory protein
MRESAQMAVGLENNPKSPWYALAKGAYGFSLYLSGELHEAARTLEEAELSTAPVPLIRILTLSAWSLVAVELGRLPRAMELASEARGIATDGDLSETPQSSLAYTATGAVRAAQGRLDEARSEFKRGVQCRLGVPGISPWATLEAMLRLAQVLLDLGDGAGAAELIDEAQDVLTLFPDGAEAPQARLEQLRRRLVVRSRAVPAADALTEREMAVLRLLRGTLSLREIGQELYVSPNTIKTHAQAIYRKLGVSTRQDAVAHAHDIGIL